MHACPKNEPLVTVEDLRVRFGGVEALRGVSLTIRRGETLGLVGESGSGKSLTSLALMRLLPRGAVATGRVGFATGDLAGDTAEAVDLLTVPERRMQALRGRSLAMIFQEPMTALNPAMTVGRQIAEAVLVHAPRTGRRALRERVVQVMEEVALPGPARRMGDYPHQFSGGQRQRVVIAMALVNRPRLLIADEPTTALDVTVQAQILELLRRLRAEHGSAMLFISHDLAVVGSIADRIAVMQGGVVVECGPAREVLLRPQHAYTRKLLASAPTLTTARDRPLATSEARSGEAEASRGMEVLPA